MCFPFCFCQIDVHNFLFTYMLLISLQLLGFLFFTNDDCMLVKYVQIYVDAYIYSVYTRLDQRKRFEITFVTKCVLLNEFILTLRPTTRLHANVKMNMNATRSLNFYSLKCCCWRCFLPSLSLLLLHRLP